MKDIKCFDKKTKKGKYTTCKDNNTGKQLRKGEKPSSSKTRKSRKSRKSSFMMDMISAEEELAALMAVDELNNMLVQDRIATPIDRAVVKTPAKAPTKQVKQKVPPLTKGLTNLGWTIQYGKRYPTIPYYFNIKTGEQLWKRPPDPLFRSSVEQGHLDGYNKWMDIYEKSPLFGLRLR